jgi:hypothetical protein
MNASDLTCSRCGRPFTLGTQYCSNCGEPVSPALVAELRDLYAVLRALDAQVAAGRGDRTVAMLRDEVQARYLTLRTDPMRIASQTITAGQASSASTAAAAVATAAGAVDAGQAGVTPRPAPMPTLPAPTPVAQPQRPPRAAFSWRAFLSEQAIAIMAYLGAFLLLVATLAFLLGGWQGLSDGIKLLVVLAVYIVFGALGIGLRRARDLRTVSSAYLGIFALMTPLVALAFYRFVLQSTGFPVAGMICLGALYAALVYLALALRTEVQVYAYLGWLALGVALSQLLVWTEAGTSLYGYVAAVFGLALLLAARMDRWQVAVRLGQPARIVSLLASAVALWIIGIGGLAELGTALFGQPSRPNGTLLLAAGMLVALGVGWSATLREWQPQQAGLVAASDIAAAAIGALAVLLLALQLAIGADGLPGVMALLALGALAAAVRYHRATPTLAAQRYGLEALALTLIGMGVLSPTSGSDPHWALISVLSAGMLVAVGIAVLEGAPWWALLAGFFLTLDYLQLGRAFLPPSRLVQDAAPLYVPLTVAVWALALWLRRQGRTRRFALPVYAVALGDALLTSVLVFNNPSPDIQTLIFLLFLALAVIAARDVGKPIVGGIVVGLFGLVVSVPWGGEPGAHDLKGALLAVGLSGAALAARRTQGRPLALPLYVAGLWSVALAVAEAGKAGAVTAQWVVLDVPFATILLLVVTAIAAAIALAEGTPWATAAPAVLSLLAVLTTGTHLIAGAFPFAFAAVGVVLRRARGRWWGVGWYGAAFVAAWLVLADLPALGAWGATAQAPVGLVMAVAAFAVARLERQPFASAVMALFVTYAAFRIQGPNEVALTIALTVALAIAGFAVSRWQGIQWGAAVYGAAALASFFAIGRAYALGPNQGGALLLVLAALAYVIAQLEGQPFAGVAAVLYGAGAVFARPDAHALLPLTVVCAVLGVAAGRLGGIRVSFPLYAVAAVSGIVMSLAGIQEPGFEAIALAVLAAIVYAIAAIESRPEAVAAALLLGVLALVATVSALSLDSWLVVLAFAGLAWLYVLGRYLWGALPSLPSRGVASEMVSGGEGAERERQRAERRALGIRIHRWASVLVSAGAAVGGIIAPDAFTPHASQTGVLGAALLSFAGILAVLGRETSVRLALYGAGGLVALAITLGVRWLGAENAQAFILAPGSYLLLCGALMPADEAVSQGERWGAGASLAGSLLLLTVTTAQTFPGDSGWIYAIVLAVEALLIAGVGLGTRSRALIVVGSAFVVLAALRAAILAISSGVPVAVVLALASLLVLGAATWLSLRARRGLGGDQQKARS